MKKKSNFVNFLVAPAVLLVSASTIQLLWLFAGF